MAAKKTRLAVSFWTAILFVVLLIDAVGTNAGPIRVETKTVPLNADDTSVITVGKLRYLGGLEMRSPELALAVCQLPPCRPSSPRTCHRSRHPLAQTV